MRNSEDAPNQPWHETVWQLDIEDMPWAQNTRGDVEFVRKALGLTGQQRILDLACGIGRHAVEFARRGHPVVAVDYSSKLIARGQAIAEQEKVDVTFLAADIRELSFREEFDVVLNLWEGAIGYMSTDEENLEVFRVIGQALKPGGQHLAGPLINADFARRHFPVHLWEKTDKMITLSELQWVAESSTILDTSWRLNITADNTWKMDETAYVASYRLYSPAEIVSIMNSVGMSVLDFYRHPALSQGVSEVDMEYWLRSSKCQFDTTQ